MAVVRSNMRWRLTALAVLIPLVTVAVVFIWQDYESRRTQMLVNLELKSAQINTQLEDFVNSTESVARVFAEGFVREHPNPAQEFARPAGSAIASNPYLLELLRVHPGRYERASIVDHGGTLLASSQPFVAGSPMRDAIFAEQVRVSNDFLVSGVFVPTDGTKASVTFSYPLRARDGVPVAYVVLNAELATVSGALDMSGGFPQSAKSGIFDGTGRVLAGAGYQAPHPGLAVGKDISQTPVGQQALMRPTTSWYGPGLDGVARIIFFTYPKKTPWVTTVGFAHSELSGPLWSRVYLFSGGLALSLLGTIVLAELAGRRERRAWNAVAQERQTLGSVIEGATDGILVLDPAGRVVRVNRRFCELFDFAPTRVGSGSPTFAEQLAGACTLDAANAARVEGMLTDPQVTSSSIVVHGLRERDLHLTAYPIGADGHTTGRTLVARDVTDENRVRRMKSEFVAHASHQLRTPLTGILTSSELLLEAPIDEPATHARWLNIVHSQALRMRSTINTLLNLSQIESGWISVLREEFDLEALACRITGDLARDHATHQFEVQFDGDARRVRADRAKIEEVLHNLLDNAIKYSPAGGTIAVKGTRAAGGKILVEVRDCGVGIRQDDIRLLFSPYERGSAEDRGLASGTGLGLYIVKSLVELHGGEAWVESELGFGTSFFFTLDHAEVRELAAAG